MRINWNEDWGFCAEYKDEINSKEFNVDTMERVRIPHTIIETPFHYFDSTVYEMVSGYRKEFMALEEWKNKSVILTFEGAAQETALFVNGRQVLVHPCGYTAFSVDISTYLEFGKNNFVSVRLDCRETLNQPPFGHVIDYMTYGGIYREVYLEIKEKTYLQDVFVATTNVLDTTKRLQVQVTLNHCEEGCSFVQSLFDAKGNEVASFRECQMKETPELLERGTELNNGIKLENCGATTQENACVTTVTHGVTGVELWDCNNPNLYTLVTKLFFQGQELDEKTVRFGFREAEFRKDGFYLNGEKLKLRGLNRHQSYPYVGYAMPKRAQQTDARILKEELGVNAVRTSHYPQSHHFLDACDELGLLVFTELPGWQHIGDDAWKEIACKNVEDMIKQYRNHTSIILWGVRINESQDDDEFYEKTNRIAHDLDTTRKTGGVRYFKKSHLLEDVYTYNDFLHRGNNEGVSKKSEVTPDLEKPYLISEYNGHMFPTKSFDKEEVRLEHALRHAKVMSDFYKEEDIAGGFGWCMFDYNTHKDFGSGDRICYHGVMDPYRNPKVAASVYASQSEKEPYFEMSSTMDIGEHPAGNVERVYAFTNCDSVKMYRNDVFLKEFFPNKEEYGGLPHPPILIDDFIGEAMEQGEGFSHKKAELIKKLLYKGVRQGVEAFTLKDKCQVVWMMIRYGMTANKGGALYYKYIGTWGAQVTCYRFEAVKNGNVVKTIRKEQKSDPVLEYKVDTQTLKEEKTYDVASVRFRMTDEYGNLLPFYQEPLQLSVEGPISLIGPAVISLKGGMGGTYVKTSGTGDATLTITTTEHKIYKISFVVEESRNNQ